MQDRPNGALKHRIESGIHPGGARLLEILGELGRHGGVNYREGGMDSPV